MVLNNLVAVYLKSAITGNYRVDPVTLASKKGDGGEDVLLREKWPKYHFFGLAFSHYHGNHFAKFFAHFLSWVKTYHHAEF